MLYIIINLKVGSVQAYTLVPAQHCWHKVGQYYPSQVPTAPGYVTFPLLSVSLE